MSPREFFEFYSVAISTTRSISEFKCGGKPIMLVSMNPRMIVDVAWSLESLRDIR